MDDIPTFEDLMRPLLEFAEDGQEHSINEAEKYFTKKFRLTSEQKNRKKSSGYERIFLGRIRWARLYLRKEGLVSDTKKKAHYKITSSGKKLLDTPKPIITKTLMDYPNFEKWKKKIYVSKKIHEAIPVEKYGIVVLLDFLGTKGIWKQPSSSQLIKKWVNFIKDFEKEVYAKLKPIGEISFVAFSDTIIITMIPKNMKSALLEVSSLLSSFIIQSMIIQRPLRGCFSIGKIIRDDFLILGSAIDEAEEYYELPQWVGVSATASSHRKIDELFGKFPEDDNFVFRRTMIPLNSSIEQNAWAVNWPDIAEPQKIQEMSKKWDEEFETMHDIFSANIRDISKIGPSLKWRNTIKFFEDGDFIYEES